MSHKLHVLVARGLEKRLPDGYWQLSATSIAELMAPSVADALDTAASYAFHKVYPTVIDSVWEGARLLNR